jgi:thioredoxin 1
MGADLAIKGSDFGHQVLESDMPVLVDFWAEWCGPCKAIGPDVEQIATEYAGKAKVYKLNVDNDSDIAIKYNVMSIPVLMVFKGGKEVERIVGRVPKQQIADMLNRAL